MTCLIVLRNELRWRNRYFPPGIVESPCGKMHMRHTNGKRTCAGTGCNSGSTNLWLPHSPDRPRPLPRQEPNRQISGCGRRAIFGEDLGYLGPTAHRRRNGLEKYYTLVARDSQGRVHRETRGFIAANSNEESPLRSITILDPVSTTRTVCAESSMTCANGVFRPRLSLAEALQGLPVSSGNVSRESLGQRTIYGLPVPGTRETATGIAGSNGSSRVALSHTEVWYSPDMHTAMSVIRSNPQLGQVTLTVTNLIRAEPDTSLFTPPSGFEVRSTQNN